VLPQRVVYLDMATGQTETEEIPEVTTRRFLGGRGINMHLLYHHTTEKTGPLSPENPLIIGAGLLTGLAGLGTSRSSISAKSPETGLLGDANIGGYFGPALRRAGLSHFVITGAAEQPSYLYLDNGRVSIEDARDLWGKSTIETNDILKDRHGSSSEVVSIGLAGENLVRFAAIMHRRKNAAARTGLGCLMGAKKIKAIVVRGDQPVKANDVAGYTALVKRLQQRLAAEPLIKLLGDFGSPFLYMLINRRMGMGRVYNGQAMRFPDGKDLSPSVLKDRFYRKRAGCRACPVACHHEYAVDGVSGVGPEYSILGSFGPLLGIKNMETVLRANDLLNRYGLDASSTGNLIAWAIELSQRGLISEADTDGRRLNWGDDQRVIELIQEIAERRGFGNQLADGAREAAQKLGGEAARYLIWTKYLPQSDPVDLRCFPAYALGNSLASRGSDHLRSRPTWEAHGIPEETLERIYGGPVPSNPQSYEGKGRVIWWWETFLALIDALGLCKLIAHNVSPGTLDFATLSELIGLSTGLEIDTDELLAIGERIVNLERMFLVREGVNREHDYPPERYFEPLVSPDGLKPEEKDMALDRGRFDGMLDEYYELRGWDACGIPRMSTLERLGLD
jgi:aldehyde:ferredoxin oxidoreductase